MSAHAAGIPKPTLFSLPVPELIPLSEALPMIGIAFWCVWAAYTTTEPPKVATSTMVSLDVMADAAEPSIAAVLASATCVVVAPNNTLPDHHITVERTVDEHCTCPANKLSLFLNGIAVEPPEVATSAAEPPKVSVVSIYDLSACPVMAMEAVCELSSCPVMAMEAVCELLPCSEPADEAISELFSCSQSAMEADCELSVRLVSTYESDIELFVLPVSVTELSDYLVSVN